MTLNILIAPSGFKESLDAEQVADCIATGITRVLPDVKIRKAPLVDGGASGGMGTGLHALIGAKLHPRYDIVMQYLELDNLIPEADLVITAEGCIDFQTPRGKIPAEVAKRAKRYNLPVIALVGTIGEGAEINFQQGIDYFNSILTHPCQLGEAISQTSTLLTNASEQLARLLLVGRQII
ncbi:hypothetical protein CEN39_20215 [Fischerella thermalis CCMEE 5201]|jgi:glycerate kinase|nr:hypothetical protein CEN39_20215 [Fischerella thermalis CCMEE 5201]